jgi:hypothetical protein
MVKGNWERRAELVAARREEERNKKAQKSVKSKDASAESVMTKLQRDSSLLDSGAKIEVWLEPDTPVLVCTNWLRTEECSVKKCKFVHATNIAHLKGMELNFLTKQPTENMCVGPVPFDNVTSKDFAAIRFIAVNGTCVYDFSFPEVWVKWQAERLQYLGGLCLSRKSNELFSIPECGGIEVSGVDVCGIRGAGVVRVGPAEYEEDEVVAGALMLSLEPLPEVQKSPDFGLFFLDSANQSMGPFSVILSKLVLFLTPDETLRLAQGSKTLYQQSIKVELVRLRRKEGLSAYMSDVSKLKKSEKKKKIKQANVKKESKKDGFARGGNSH